MWLTSRILAKSPFIVVLSIMAIVLLSSSVDGQNRASKSHTIENLQNEKEFKKLLKTKNNILSLFMMSTKENQNILKIFRESSELVKGLGTLVVIDCSAGEMKKFCKKLKISPPFAIKHYKDGEYHKDYDRAITVTSVSNFLKDPTGDLPWEEDETGVDVVHIPDPSALTKLLKKERRPILMMFYAPWCGFCKRLKPDFSQAATELKKDFVLAAIDLNRPENSALRRQYNISGFPTLLYFENGVPKYTFEGENNKNGIIAFMKNPTATPPKQQEEDWSAVSSEIVHLTSSSFEPALKDEKSVLVMFYAPWCGHCKKMKPEYEKAAEKMKIEKIPGVLAALDATKESQIGAKYGVKGYPTVKYFVNGEFKYDVNVRDADKIVEFMKDPKEMPLPEPEKAWEEEPSEVVHLNDENFKPFLKKKTHALVMFYAPWCGHCKRTKPEFVKAAEKFVDEPGIELAAVDCTKYQALCSFYNVKGYPTIKYFNYLKNVRDYNGGRTEADFVKFLTNPDESQKEENTPKQDTFGEYPGVEKVLLLSEKSFDDELQKYDQVLVMFYAPWCGHCSKMKPAYVEAAVMLENEKLFNSKIAAVDCTVHKKLSERFEIRGFPTLKLFSKGQLKAEYDGKRTAEAIVEYMKATDKQSKRDEL
ncbi:protein disulfide-isomerase A5 [Culicoides brevitarsis]|uniref:protein disulfide-isomerase A5 n=1 Tax=Culicoides brevitarsis TaxID=469753 RepID=UPI00307C0FBA